jgi:hypothetical protein
MRRSTAASPARWSTRRSRRRPERGHARPVGDLHAGVANYAASTKDGVADRDAGGHLDYLECARAIVYGTALSTQLNATVDGGIAGTLVYTPLEGVVLNAARTSCR